MPNSKQKDNSVNCKPKAKQKKWLGAAPPTLATENVSTENYTSRSYKFISNDLWYHIAKYIQPEDVQRFAMICKQTAAIVETRAFWKRLYQQYVHTFCARQWKSHKLPKNLQLESINNGDMRLIRSNVIKSLFYCHPPLMNLIRRSYSLDALRSQAYVSSWHLKCECVWIMCYKFCKWKRVQPSAIHYEEENATELVDNWESLASDNDVTSTAARHFENPHEGVYLLVICCDRYIPFPMNLLYSDEPTRKHLISSRQMLSKDMRGSNLELDFADPVSNHVTTIKYPKILKFKVLPWWDPDFERFIK